jgi:hypothetical protein
VRLWRRRLVEEEGSWRRGNRFDWGASCALERRELLALSKSIDPCD